MVGVETVGVDTNILIYAHDRSSVFADKSVELLSRLRDGGRVAIASLSLLEFFAVMTDGRKIRRPLSPEEASDIIKDFLEADEFLILYDAEEVHKETIAHAATHRISRYRINDVQIAKTFEHHGISTIYTFNIKDFRQFDSIKAINPFEGKKEAAPRIEKPFIPYGRQSIDEQDVASVCSVLRSDWLTTGPKVDEFERAVADYVGAAHGAAVSSGTAALHCAMYALGIGPGDEVIVPPMTFAATANCVGYQGGTPVFADVEPNTLLIDPAEVEKKITDRTRAIIAVDYAGQPCDYDALRGIADRHGLFLVADGCHALGAEYRGRKVGTLADMTIFSFHPVKHIATGEGGMVVTDREEYVEKIRLFRNHGITTDHRQREALGSWYYEMVEMGYNYRMTDIQCALGISQLKKLPAFLERRREIAARYDRAFAGVDQVLPMAARSDVSHVYHLYVVRVAKANRSLLFRQLRSAGIGVNVHYIPVHLHPFYRKRMNTGPGQCPVAEGAYQRVLSLPIYPAMTDDEVDRVIGEVTANVNR